MTTIPTSQKPDVIRLLLETEGRVMLCVDATKPGVQVPRRFSSDNGLRLILNSIMPQPIEIGPKAVESELRFGGIPHYCVIPYEALWGVFNPDTHHGMFWTESMPEEIRKQHGLEESLTQLPKPEPTPVPEAEPVPKNKKRFELRVIEGGDTPSATIAPEKRTRPNLRLVP
ncbi:MAG: ClpXP protease specificity-enhancing factor SspB [Magnetococcus sp. YQC-5]